MSLGFFSDNSVFYTCSLSAELPETAEEPSVVVHCTSGDTECWVGACIYYSDGSRFFGCTVSKLEDPLSWTKTDLSSTDLQNGNTYIRMFFLLLSYLFCIVLYIAPWVVEFFMRKLFKDLVL